MARAADSETVSIDFDGVIHEYRQPFASPVEIPDAPVRGAREAISKLRRKYFVVVCSTRCMSQAGTRAVERWLRKHRIKFDLVTDMKLPARAYIDDRAIPFKGDWTKIPDMVDKLRPWNRKEKK